MAASPPESCIPTPDSNSTPAPIPQVINSNQFHYSINLKLDEIAMEISSVTCNSWTWALLLSRWHDSTTSNHCYWYPRCNCQVLAATHGIVKIDWLLLGFRRALVPLFSLERSAARCRLIYGWCFTGPTRLSPCSILLAGLAVSR